MFDRRPSCTRLRGASPGGADAVNRRPHLDRLPVGEVARISRRRRAGLRSVGDCVGRCVGQRRAQPPDSCPADVRVGTGEDDAGRASVSSSAACVARARVAVVPVRTTTTRRACSTPDTSSSCGIDDETRSPDLAAFRLDVRVMLMLDDCMKRRPLRLRQVRARRAVWPAPSDSCR